jgi:hypothetical protein
MPCYSNIKTVMLDIATIEQVAAELGIKVEKRNANSYTLRKDREYITIERDALDQPFHTRAYSGSNAWDTQIMDPMLPAYAKAQIKKVMKAKGYTVASGSKPNELVFTSYK